MLRPALIVLFCAGALGGQTAEWRNLLDQAVEADDYADYKTAEALFTQACEQAQRFDSTEHQVEACGGLARVQAIDNNLGKARKTLRELVERIELSADPHGYSHALALLSLADAETAMGNLDEAVALIPRVNELIPTLTPVQRAEVFAAIAEMYLPGPNKRHGESNLGAAVAALAAGWDAHDAASVKLANRLARTGFFFRSP